VAQASEWREWRVVGEEKTFLGNLFGAAASRTEFEGFASRCWAERFVAKNAIEDRLATLGLDTYEEEWSMAPGWRKAAAAEGGSYRGKTLGANGDSAPGLLGRRCTWVQDFPGSGEVFFTDENLESEARPCQVLTHATDAVGLDGGGDVGGVEFADGQFGFGAGAVGVNDDKIGMVHGNSIGPSGAGGGG